MRKAPELSDHLVVSDTDLRAVVDRIRELVETLHHLRAIASEMRESSRAMRERVHDSMVEHRRLRAAWGFPLGDSDPTR